MKTEIIFSSFDTEALLARFGKKIPGAGLLGKTLLKHPKKLGDLALPLAKKIIKDKGFDMDLRGITVNADNAVVKSVVVDVARINYAQVGVAALPMAEQFLHRAPTVQDVTDAMEKVDLPDNEAFARVKEAVAAQNDVPAMIRAGAAAISDAEKLTLAQALLTAYQDKLCEAGNDLLAKKRLPATVCAVTLEA